MKNRIFIFIFIFIISFVFVNPYFCWAQESDLDKMLNYDSKTRVAKIIKDSIAEDKKAGKSIDYKKIKDRILTKPLMAHFLIETGFTVLGNISQFALAGLPGGTVAGTLIDAVTGNLGGAIGYEVSVSLEKGEKKPLKNYLGDAISSIDGGLFINQTAFAIAGAVIGSTIFPIPGIGAVVGSFAGKFLGTFFTTKTRNTSIGKKVYPEIQKIWDKFGKVAKGDKETKAVTTTNSYREKISALQTQYHDALEQGDLKKAQEIYNTLKKYQAKP